MQENKNQRKGALEEGQTDQNVMSNMGSFPVGCRRTLFSEVVETPVVSEAGLGKAKS